MLGECLDHFGGVLEHFGGVLQHFGGGGSFFLTQVAQMQGGYKLKIPTLLLNEKEKTRSRFAQVWEPSSTYVLGEDDPWK